MQLLGFDAHGPNGNDPLRAGPGTEVPPPRPVPAASVRSRARWQDAAMPAPDYADEYAAARASVRTLLADSDDAAARTVVPSCPDWTVHDLCAHLVGVPAALVARDNPPPGDNQDWVDGHVTARSERSLAELLDEWDDVGPAFEGLMRKLPRAFGGLVYDAVAHEHDLRGALGRPGGRDSSGVLASVELLVAMVERDLAVHGPVPGTLRLQADDREWVVGAGEPTVALTTTPFELMRLLGSRRSEDQIVAAPWVGDVTPFLPALAHMPLPARAIVE
jgi:uncharacterized protein (TIGR03083 family)